MSAPRRQAPGEPLEVTHLPRRAAAADHHERNVIAGMFAVALVVAGLMFGLARWVT